MHRSSKLSHRQDGGDRGVVHRKTLSMECGKVFAKRMQEPFNERSCLSLFDELIVIASKTPKSVNLRET